MWVARNRDGELRVFEMPPRRFHSGSALPYEKTGFNDAVYIDEGKEDAYSFWAIQEFYESNTIDDRKAYGMKLFMTKGKDVWGTYEPEWAKAITWEDEPIEVEVVSINELLSQQNELKDVYHELIEYQTSKIYNLTRVYRGVQLEEVGNIIKDTEEKIHDKYKMIGNPNCSQNCRAVTIPHSSVQLGDNSLREYVVDDKVVATIYVRRNDFNNADILVSDLGNEYCTTK